MPNSRPGPSPPSLPPVAQAVTEAVTESGEIGVRNPNKIPLPHPRIQRQPSQPIPPLPSNQSRASSPSPSIRRDSLQPIPNTGPIDLPPSARPCQPGPDICVHVQVDIGHNLHSAPPFPAYSTRDERYNHTCHSERSYRERSPDRRFAYSYYKYVPLQDERRPRSRSPGIRVAQPLNDRRQMGSPLQAGRQFFRNGSPVRFLRPPPRLIGSDLHPSNLGEHRGRSRSLSQLRRQSLSLVTPARPLQPTPHAHGSALHPSNLVGNGGVSQPPSQARRQSLPIATPLQPTRYTFASDLRPSNLKENFQSVSEARCQSALYDATPDRSLQPTCHTVASANFKQL